MKKELKRHQIKKTYEQHLAQIPGIRVLTNLENERSSYQYFVIEIDENKYGKTRDWIHEELKKYNVFTRKYFYPLCSDFHWYKHLDSAQPENLPQAQKTVKKFWLCRITVNSRLKSVVKICEILKNFMKKK